MAINMIVTEMKWERDGNKWWVNGIILLKNKVVKHQCRSQKTQKFEINLIIHKKHGSYIG